MSWGLGARVTRLCLPLRGVDDLVQCGVAMGDVGVQLVLDKGGNCLAGLALGAVHGEAPVLHPGLALVV